MAAIPKIGRITEPEVALNKRVIRTADGCKYATTCLECPLSDCVVTNSGSKLAYRKPAAHRIGRMVARNERIVAAVLDGRSIRNVASTFGVSYQTVAKCTRKARRMVAHG